MGKDRGISYDLGLAGLRLPELLPNKSISSANHLDSAGPVDLGSRSPVPGFSPADAAATWEQKSASEEVLRKRTVVMTLPIGRDWSSSCGLGLAGSQLPESLLNETIFIW